jgi:hypothetical protein
LALLSWLGQQQLPSSLEASLAEAGHRVIMAASDLEELNETAIWPAAVVPLRATAFTPGDELRRRPEHGSLHSRDPSAALFLGKLVPQVAHAALPGGEPFRFAVGLLT